MTLIYYAAFVAYMSVVVGACVVTVINAAKADSGKQKLKLIIDAVGFIMFGVLGGWYFLAH